MNGVTPTIFIILGATGDLMRRKIIPALFNLFQENSLPPKFRVIGFAKKEFTSETFRDYVKDVLGRQTDSASKDNLQKFLQSFYYCRGNLNELNHFQCIAGEVAATDNDWRVCSNKLFYLAIYPDLYKATLTNLSKSGLTKPCSEQEGWTRVLVEKPFGKNLKTAKELDILLGKLFKEVQIYRLDHYLGKEMVQNILNFRFSNNLFEGIWSNKFVEKINIRLWEKIGVEQRGGFYDGLGALRDVGQNHLLQMLALVGMENPGSLDASITRNRKAEVLEQLHCLSRKEIASGTFRAQYEGYRNIDGVRPDSTTETYFKVKTFIDSPRWRGVPIVLESGKRLGEVRKEVVVTLRHPTPCLLCPPGIDEHYKNQIQIAMEPQEVIRAYFWSKKIGGKYQLEKQSLDFLLREPKARTQYVKEYEQLLLDAIAGDQTSFVSTNEITAMWRFTDPLVRAWENNRTPLASYKPDTVEPIEASKHIETPELIQSSTKHYASAGMRREVGIVGLGKMGANMARRLKGLGWRVVGYDTNAAVKDGFIKDGIITVDSFTDMAANLSLPRIIWFMTPAGKPTELAIFGKKGAVEFLQKGDIIIDGGNSFYKDSIRRFDKLSDRGIHFVDVGVSGGPEGALRGASLMVGGKRSVFTRLEPLFKDLAGENAVQFFEGSGAGHFAKMIHNGIEYGMMQAIAEGFTILKKAGKATEVESKLPKWKLDLVRVADVYNHGSVIESRLMGWMRDAFEAYGDDLKDISGIVGHTGEGEWTAKTAKALGVKAKIIEGALRFRKQSVKNPDYMGRVLTALRNRFGGHNIR